MKTGIVTMVTGQSYMLSSDETLWEKVVPPNVEALLLKEVTRDQKKQGTLSSTARDLTRVITFRTPHNSAVQIYDYKSKTARVVLGPDLVMLGPDEQFTGIFFFLFDISLFVPLISICVLICFSQLLVW